MLASKTSVVILALFLAPLLSPLTAVCQQANVLPPSEWLRPGIQASYEVIYASRKGGGVEAPGVTVVSGEGVGWTSEIPIVIPSKASVTYAVDLYAVKAVDPVKGVVLDKLTVYASLVGNVDNPVVKSEYAAGLKSGPFWVDPTPLARARVGDTLTILDSDGREVESRVVFRGALDVSGLSKSKNSIAGALGLSYSLPVPEGTFRDVVVLASKPSPNERLGMIIDTELGLVYYQGLSRREKGSYSVVVMMLSGINVDLEDVLPSYKTKSYDYGPLMRPGYLFYSEWGYMDVYVSSIVRIILFISGFYKNFVSVGETIFASLNEAVAAYSYAWIVDVENHRARIALKVDLLNLGVEPVKAEGAPLLVAPLASQGPLVVYGVPYTAQGRGVYAAEELPRDRLGFPRLEYNEQGLLVDAEAAIAGIPLTGGPRAKWSSASVLATVYYSYPWHTLQGGVIGGQEGKEKSGQQQPPLLNITPLVESAGKEGPGQGEAQPATPGSHGGEPGTITHTGSEGPGGGQKPTAMASTTSSIYPDWAAGGHSWGTAPGRESRRTEAKTVNTTASTTQSGVGGEGNVGLALSIAATLAIVAATVIYARRRAGTLG
jgi:hypothetical protein